MHAGADFTSGTTPEGMLRNPRTPYDTYTVDTDDGARIHVRAYGPAQAPPVVLVHGYACRIEYWNPQINSLSSRYRVIAYDQRGLGRSTMGSAGVRPQVLGDDLAAVLDATVPSERPAVIVGHSFGGITAMAWAERHPDQVRVRAIAVLLADTVAERFKATTALVPFSGRYPALRRPLLNMIARSRIRLPERAPVQRAVRRIAMSPRATLEKAEYLWAMVSAVDPATRVTWGEGLSGLDVRAGIDNVGVPTTVLVGSQDRLTPPRAAQQIEALLRDRGSLHKYVEVPGVGHCSNIEAPHAFDAEIIELRELHR